MSGLTQRQRAIGAILALGDAMRCRAGSAQERSLAWELPLQILDRTYARLVEVRPKCRGTPAVDPYQI
ncbi:MAG: hypothetical protein F6J93_25155 [Oscillatoria sp. SIO1A7]|nr:hypothetical protein [Oscillatoria sp. SIO1A7]